jgi:hypothetical protein
MGTFRFGIFLTHVQGNRPTGPQHCNYLDCLQAPRFGLRVGRLSVYGVGGHELANVQ